MLKHTWRPATGTDITAMIEHCEQVLLHEIDTIFIPEYHVYARNVTQAVVNQHFCPTKELFSISEQNGKIIAITWAKVCERSMWSDEDMVSVVIAHADPSLSTRLRIELIQDMFVLWERFANLSNIKIIASNSLRKEQQAFLKLHARAGYEMRGSYAYKRLSA